MYQKGTKEHGTGQRREKDDQDRAGEYAGPAARDAHAGRRASDLFMQDVREDCEEAETGGGIRLDVLLEMRSDAAVAVI